MFRFSQEDKVKKRTSENSLILVPIVPDFYQNIGHYHFVHFKNRFAIIIYSYFLCIKMQNLILKKISTFLIRTIMFTVIYILKFPHGIFLWTSWVVSRTSGQWPKYGNYLTVTMQRTCVTRSRLIVGHHFFILRCHRYRKAFFTEYRCEYVWNCYRNVKRFHRLPSCINHHTWSDINEDFHNYKLFQMY